MNQPLSPTHCTVLGGHYLISWIEKTKNRAQEGSLNMGKMCSFNIVPNGLSMIFKNHSQGVLKIKMLRNSHHSKTRLDLEW